MRNPFDFPTDDASPTGDLGATIPPYKGRSPTSGQITTGFDGLAMPPVRQTDVFSQMSTPAAFAAGLAGSFDDEIFSRGGKVPPQPPQSEQPQQKQPPPPPPQQQPAPPPVEASHPEPAAAQPVTEEHPDDGVWADDSPAEEQPVGAAESSRGPRALPTPPAFPDSGEGQPPAPPKRKRRWFGLRMLLVLMLLLSVGAAGGIYGLVKKQTNVLGKLRFDNAESLKAIEQQQLLNGQKKMLGDQALREEARKLLAQRHANVSPGFLADPVAYEAAARKVDWAPGGQRAVAFPYSGTDARGDGPRVHAVMLALYDANTKAAGKSGGGTSLRATVESLSAAHTKSQQRVNDLKAQIERLGATAQQMPDRKRMDELHADVVRLDKAYDDARRAARDLTDEVERMQKGLPANPQPAGTAQSPVTDPELTKMQEQLAATTAKLTEAKAARAKAAESAHVALDAALEQFQKQIAGAQGTAKDNPELSAYVAAAQKLQTSTRELTEQLIRRQQQQQQQLAELKTRLSEKMELRRADAWKKDPKLKEYTDELAIVQRQYNAAVGGGAKKEAEEFRSQIDLLEKMVKARQTLVEDDPFYADAINQLQKIINDQQRGIDNDRKHTEAVLEEMQAAFTKSQPAVEKMPEAQRALAATLEKELASVTAARRQYTQAADAAAAVGDEETKKLEASSVALATKVESRRKELATAAEKAATAEQEQGRVRAVQERQAALVAAQTKELEAQKAADAARTALREAQALEKEAREAGEKRDALAAERVAAEQELAAQLRQLELKTAEAKRTVEPIAPTENDVEVSIHDPRPVYALASVGGIVAVFTLLILFTSTGAGAQDDAAALADLSPFDNRPPPTPMPQDSAAQHVDEQPRVAV